MALLLALAACTSDPAIDTAALEEDIAAALVPADPSAVTSVVCPNAAEASPGDPIDCTVLVGVQELPVTVAFGEDRVVSVTPGLPLLDGVAAAEQVAERFTAELAITTTVECEQPLIVLVPDAEFDCVATDDKGVARTLTVRVDDDAQLVVGVR